MTNDEIITNSSNSKKNYDLEERTAKFGEYIIEFAKKIPVSPVTRSLIDQLVRAGTSIGANYCEANDASSRKDFFNKIGTCRKESKESKHWLRMISKAISNLKKEANILWSEAQELNLIFSSIKKKDKPV
jgi:four helix bundle protein